MFPYFKAGDYLSPWELIESATISRARAYVEFVVGRVKRFAFLDSYPVKRSSFPLLDDALYVACYLTHLMGPIVFAREEGEGMQG